MKRGVYCFWVVQAGLNWYNNTYLLQDEEYRKAFVGIYIIDEDNKLYKLTESGFIECTIKELIERNLTYSFKIFYEHFKSGDKNLLTVAAHLHTSCLASQRITRAGY